VADCDCDPDGPEYHCNDCGLRHPDHSPDCRWVCGPGLSDVNQPDQVELVRSVLAKLEDQLKHGVPLSLGDHSWTWRPSAADVIDEVRLAMRKSHG